jgi:hypothetical protein
MREVKRTALERRDREGGPLDNLGKQKGHESEVCVAREVLIANLCVHFLRVRMIPHLHNPRPNTFSSTSDDEKRRRGTHIAEVVLRRLIERVRREEVILGQLKKESKK